MHEHMTSAKQRDYAISLHLPQGDPPEGGHAVVWLLDTPTTWAPMQQALDAAGGDDMVVIGVGWDPPGAVDPDLRRRDFTQPARHEVPPPRGSADAWHEDGDADALLAFLTGTLQPHYLDALPLDAARQTLVGHSLSGLFVLQALIASPGSFQRFVAASPSIWWDQARFLEEAGQADWGAARHARVLLSVGSDEQVVGPEKPPEIEGEHEAAMLGEPHMVDNASALAELLQANGVDCRFRLFEGETHRSVLAPAMAAALAFARDAGNEPG
ncbi:alpha/beta hydrolase [Lysobacter sp. D1-1-M9]|uniref:alpha/beta hydrolase n=1 Tax=Novilysobacter longmucuonensis TaxID=3098603 RepID=UPI002FC65975